MPPLATPSGTPDVKTHPGTLGRLLGVQVFCDLEGREGEGLVKMGVFTIGLPE